MGNQEKVVLGFFAAQNYEVQSLMLGKSLRDFGGVLADLPVWIFTPEGQPLQGQALEALQDLDVDIIPSQSIMQSNNSPSPGKSSLPQLPKNAPKWRMSSWLA